MDANLNRAGEGLRVLEEVARFVLNDRDLSRELKEFRHQLSQWGQGLPLLWARAIEKDVGAPMLGASLRGREGFVDLVRANARRVQESLRVLEEFGQLPGVPSRMVPAQFEQMRFRAYDLEQRLLGKLSREEKVSKLKGLYVIIDPQALKGKNEVEVARQAITGGGGVIQLRDKLRDKKEVLATAQALREVCAEMGALFIVNDHLDVALASAADGLHLGQKDLPLASARSYLPLDKIIGCSTATLEEALRAQAEGADYVGVGSIFPTTTKEDTRPAGLETLQKVKEAVSIPVVAIGGINAGNVAQVRAVGADAVAVISAILAAEDVAAAARRMTAAMSKE
ncbi:MAG: thiamine phosphate synthase [Chloroflexi bacterium]|nr:thiamine phosphate synthase [Chloroflexota bacterium]